MCLLRASDSFWVCLFMVILTFKKLKCWSKTNRHAFQRHKSKNKDFHQFLGFSFEPYTQNRKLENQMTTNSKWFTDIAQIAFYPISLGRISYSFFFFSPLYFQLTKPYAPVFVTLVVPIMMLKIWNYEKLHGIFLCLTLAKGGLNFLQFFENVSYLLLM